MSVRYQVFGLDLEKKWTMDSIYDKKALAILSGGILLENSSYIAVRVVEVDIDPKTRTKKTSIVHYEKRPGKPIPKKKPAKSGPGGQWRSSGIFGSVIGMIVTAVLALAGVAAAAFIVWLQFFS